MEVTAEIRDWKFDKVFGQRIVVGKIYGDTRQRWPDGTKIWTSSVKRYRKKDGLVITRNSVYRMGEKAS